MKDASVSAETRECWVHKHRYLVPLDSHHIWPLAEGGPDVKDNLIDVCPNGHRSIHAYIRLLKKHDGQVPWLKRKFYGTKVRYVAVSGYDAMNQPPTEEEDNPQ